jgi:hypothetical protein
MPFVRAAGRTGSGLAGQASDPAPRESVDPG